MKASTVILLSVVSGALFAASFPPLAISAAAWLAFVPFFLALCQVKSLLAGLAGGLMGMVGTGLYLYWTWLIPGFPPGGFFLLAIYVGLYYGLFGFCVSLIVRRTGWPLALVAPTFWVGIEFLRVNAGFLAVPVGLVNHTQYENISLIQVASIISAFGVSFIIIFINAAVAETIIHLGRLRQSRAVIAFSALPFVSLLAGIAITAMLCLWGKQQIEYYDAHQKTLLKAAVVQANIPQQEKLSASSHREILERHAELSTEAAKSNPDIIIWPEAALPGYLRINLPTSRAVRALAKELGVPLLLGSASSLKSARLIHKDLPNSAFLLDQNGEIVDEYQKIKLVPFAEYVPYPDLIAWPEWLTSGSDSNTPGSGLTLFTLFNHPFGVVICWEGLFPNPFREFVRDGAQFMVNLTNEAWFDHSQAGRQFLAMAVLRAVENRVAVVRSANTGISVLIDPVGRIRARVTDLSGHDLRVAGVMTVDIPAADDISFYARHGDIFAMLCLVAAFCLLFAALLPDKIRLNMIHARLAQPITNDR